MQERHKNKEQYFNEQGLTSQKFVVPFISDLVKLDSQTTVLEIGCAEAGNLKPFVDMGCKATGIDISCSRVELAKEFYKNHQNRANLTLICEDIYKVNPDKKYDVIIMRDVIEHIPNQEIFLGFVKSFLKPDGKFFLAFPPWQNPFGGHQQICRSKILSKLPWFHLLSRPLYKFVLKAFGENEGTITALFEIKDTGISIERFERILKLENYKIDKRVFWFINPNYQTKFGLKPRKQTGIISSIPWVRGFFTTAMYYVISR
jgi:2-polyprenyl-3-methyl-5-hydroxy-6-metoxy-1,4-benzoquinol methylase